MMPASGASTLCWCDSERRQAWCKLKKTGYVRGDDMFGPIHTAWVTAVRASCAARGGLRVLGYASG